MSKNLHLMFDFETFGQLVNSCAVINCALCVFDFDRFKENPYTFQELLDEHVVLLKLDVQHQVGGLGYKIEKGALEFWKSLPEEVQKQIKPNPKKDLKVDGFCNAFLRELKGKSIQRWWSRGNNFDPVILTRLFNDCGMLDELDNVLKFWLLRDERTYVDAVTGFGLKKNNFNPLSDDEKNLFKPHDARHDVAMGVMRIQFFESETE